MKFKNVYVETTREVIYQLLELRRTSEKLLHHRGFASLEKSIVKIKVGGSKRKGAEFCGTSMIAAMTDCDNQVLIESVMRRLSKNDAQVPQTANIYLLRNCLPRLSSR